MQAGRSGPGGWMAHGPLLTWVRAPRVTCVFGDYAGPPSPADPSELPQAPPRLHCEGA